jgi:hypothetical protein
MKKHKHDNLLFKRALLEFMVELGYLKASSATMMRYTIKFNKPFSEITCDFCQSLLDNDIVRFQELSKRYIEIYTSLQSKTDNISKETSKKF